MKRADHPGVGLRIEDHKTHAHFVVSPCCLDFKINTRTVYLLDSIRINLGIDAAGNLTLNRPWWMHSLLKRTPSEERTDDQEALCFGKISREPLLQIDCHCDRCPACWGLDAAD
jgi:hypothetical protein